MIAFLQSDPDAPRVFQDSAGRTVAIASEVGGRFQCTIMGPNGQLAAMCYLDESGRPTLNLVHDGKIRAAVFLGDGIPKVIGYHPSGKVQFSIDPSNE